MNREDRKQVLPPREPMLLVDEAIQEGECSYSKYTIRGDEFFLQGHFPGRPVVPGVILCEIMAQGGAMLFAEGLGGTIPLYAGMDNVKFKKVVKPGDTVCSRATIVARRGPVFVVEAKATVDDVMCCSGRLSFILMDKNKEF